MKKSFSLIAVVALAGLLVQCAHKGDKKLEGIWQLNSMSMNGTRISGTDLGIWLWEFNEEGGYLTIVAGAKEKGKYTLKDNQLTLHNITSPNRPDQIYNVVKADSIQLELITVEEKNRTALTFIKVRSSDVGEKD
jgi:hypothetical protein